MFEAIAKCPSTFSGQQYLSLLKLCRCPNALQNATCVNDRFNSYSVRTAGYSAIYVILCSVEQGKIKTIAKFDNCRSPAWSVQFQKKLTEVCYVEKRQKDSLENSPLLCLLVSLFNVGKRQQLRLNILTNNNLEKLSMCMARN